MAKPNYGFEKRQRELEKQRKKAEKANRKASGRPPESDTTNAVPAPPPQEKQG